MRRLLLILSIIINTNLYAKSSVLIEGNIKTKEKVIINEIKDLLESDNLTEHLNEIERRLWNLRIFSQVNLAIENQKLYGDFLALTTTLLEKGETGKLPQLSARSHLGKAQLEREHANEKYQIAFHLFNQWLRSDTLYDVEEQVDIIQPVIVDTNLTNNPHLQVIQAKQELAVANVEIQKVKLLPQINSGLRLQNAFGTFPLFGYQIGANVPLFQKSYKKRIEAAEVGVKAQQSALKTEQQHLEQTLSELNYRIEHQLHILEYLQQDLQPIVDQQSELSLQAFQEGEISYLEYLDSLEQVLNVKKQYLEALYQFNLLRLELDYWLGK